ncbi:Yip1 family protein [Pseudohongiella nitratireducens]|uniref:Yip1 family protein n=1 Tax=Pseudohongiella nitratireducens TaxID=1768907 RepID=UPI0030EBC5F8|tara:strand:- start:1027 stop:1641 length:615 start_codon:yes stop_codon:yes gene_type:complete
MVERTLANLPVRALFRPKDAFEALAGSDPSPANVLLRYSVWLLILPPLFSWIGASIFGWRLGATEPLYLSQLTLVRISVGYFLALLFGFVSTALISQWMAKTYGASESLGRHFAMVTIVGSPLALASVAHLVPDVFFNVLVLIPTMIWSMYLLYSGIAVALETVPERGMLMASSPVGWLLVAAVSLLGLSMGLWVMGIGPLLGV